MAAAVREAAAETEELWIQVVYLGGSTAAVASPSRHGTAASRQGLATVVNRVTMVPVVFGRYQASTAAATAAVALVHLIKRQPKERT